MTASPPRRTPSNLPAFVLAFALWVGLTVTGLRVVEAVRTAPGTVMPMQALSETRHKPGTEVRLAPRPEVGPAWGELTTPQKEALYPLANRWSVLSEVQKRHWLKLAAGFHALTPLEQEKMLARLTDWASLSAQQRSQARLNYATANTLSVDSKRAKWEAYQALSEQERQRLAAKAAARPAGAAPAIRPSPKKLAQVPAAINAPATTANPPKIPKPSDAHVPQALPVPTPALTPASTPTAAPVVVETRPVEIPSARATALPPLAPEESSSAPSTSGSDGASFPYLPQ